MRVRKTIRTSWTLLPPLVDDNAPAYDRFGSETLMTRVAIAGLGAIGRVLARRLHEGIPGLTLACAVGARSRQGAGLARRTAHRLSAGRTRRHARPRRSRGRMRAGGSDREHLPADAGGRQGGDGAERRRAAGATASDGPGAGQGRPDHRADRRAARARCRDRGGRGPDRIGPHDHPQAAPTGSPARPI